MGRKNPECLEDIVDCFYYDREIDSVELAGILNGTETTLDNAKGFFYGLKQKGFDEGTIESFGLFLENEEVFSGCNAESSKKYGLDDAEVISKAKSFGGKIGTVSQAYKCLRSIGLNSEKIASKTNLLGLSPFDIMVNYENLISLGLSRKRIISRAELLGMDPQSVRENYENLISLGLSRKRIISRAELLGKDPQSVWENYENLLRLGFSHKKIIYRADLLGNDQDTINKKFEKLLAYGMKKEKICSNIGLMAMNFETIRRNYQNHIGYLKRDYLDRKYGKEFLMKQGQLLTIPSGTVCSNVQYSTHLGVDYRSPVFLGTNVQLKRKKMAWLLREVFDYRQFSKEKKKYVKEALYGFIRDNPLYLRKSINKMEEEKKQIKTRAASYVNQVCGLDYELSNVA